ncbi:MAG TPA: SMC-Scp complex subunit ScpB [Pirellulales bacterium]|nr:SMC-Scp complex subunit ScpB [Pirellulales bacterium]
MASTADDADEAPPADGGLSLDDLNAAFAEMLSSGQDPYSEPVPVGDRDAESPDAAPLGLLSGPDEADARCEITPRSILEAMLFVGGGENQPLGSERAAGLMRGVRSAEIDDLVRELNERYDADGCPYRIESQSDGYRLALRPEYGPLRDKVLNRTRQARLSAAAVEVLSIVAYNGPQTAEEVARLRGRPSGAILSQLVRRQLLRVEREPEAPRVARYATTPRFLTLLGLESLDDLPRSQEAEPR